MKQEDMPKLFDLLGELYQRKKVPKSTVTLAIWREVLKPWSYEQVRAAVIARARENQFLPDPSEIADYLPKVEATNPPSPSPTEKELRDMEQLKQWQREWHQALASMGLPTLRQAIASGMSCGQWARMLEEAGALL